MKKLFPTFFLACALVAPAALTAATFEGKVHMQMSSGKKEAPTEMDYRIKDGLLRIDVQMPEKSGRSGAAPGIIMDMKKQEMTILMAEQQMYMVRSMAGGEARPGAAHEATGKTPDVALEQTGETETILGYKCEKYVMKSDKLVTSMWITGELGNFMSAGAGGGMGFGGSRRGGGGQQAQAWEKALAGKSMFPMRVVGTTADGKESFRMEVTAVEKKSLPASDFTAPAGWKKFEMPNMGDMMKGMMNGGGQ